MTFGWEINNLVIDGFAEEEPGKERVSGKSGAMRWIGMVVLLCVVILGGEFVYFKFPQIKELISGNPFFRARSYDVAIELGESKKAGIITVKGGKLDAEGYKLDFPKNSVLGAAEIEAQSIFSLRNLPKGTHFAAGVHLTSDEDTLGDPVELEVKIPQNFVGGKLIGFAYNEDGRAFHYYPVEIRGESAVFKIYHFSGYGILSVDDKYDSPPEASDMRDRAEQAIRGIIGEGNSDDLSGFTDSQKQRMKNILDVWYRVKVKPMVESAKKDDKVIMNAAKEFIIWWQSTHALPDMEEIFSAQIQEAKRGLAEGVNNAVDKAVRKCDQEKDPAQAGVLIKLASLAHYLGMEGISGLDSEAILAKARKCVNFEVKMTSNFSEHMVATSSVGTVTTDIRYGDSGLIPLTIDEDFSLSGEGSSKIDSYSQTGFNCAQNPPEMNSIKIPKLKFEPSTKAGVTIFFDTGETTNVVWTCTMPNQDFVSTNPNSVWDYGFYEMHTTEYQGPSEGYLFKLADWEILGKGGVYAKKEYNQTKTFVVQNVTRTVTEHTLFELIHKPR